MNRGTKAGIAVGAAAALAAVFMLYLKPELAVTLANRLWACF